MTFNVNAAQGLQPVRYLSGTPWNDAYNGQYQIASGYATAIFKGDPVVVGANGVLNIGVAGSGVHGVFWGCTYTTPGGVVAFSNFWPAGQVTLNALAAQANVIDNPDILFSIQETNAAGAAGTPLTQAACGQNFNFLVTAGSTVTGLSASSLNNASGAPGADSTLNLKVMFLDPNVANAYGNFANWLVLLNNHKLQGTGTVGHA